MIHRAMSKWGVMGNPLLSMVNKYTINLIYDHQMQELTHNNLTNREKIINHVKNKKKTPNNNSSPIVTVAPCDTSVHFLTEQARRAIK